MEKLAIMQPSSQGAYMHTVQQYVCDFLVRSRSLLLLQKQP